MEHDWERYCSILLLCKPSVRQPTFQETSSTMPCPLKMASIILLMQHLQPPRHCIHFCSKTLLSSACTSKMCEASNFCMKSLASLAKVIGQMCQAHNAMYTFPDLICKRYLKLTYCDYKMYSTCNFLLFQ